MGFLGLDGGISWKDAFLPYAVTHAAVVGGKALYEKGKEAVGAGGGGDNGYKEFTGADPAAYQYGRDPNAANDAASLAQGTGSVGMAYGAQAAGAGRDAGQFGANLMAQHNGAANAFNQRLAPQGNFAAQNQTLGQLGGLEATQGPSAAQAQLQAGTNQAMAGQLAMARSGRGFGGNAASAGLAQGNMAGIQANQANSSAALSAQEDAAWRGRQAANLGNVAGFQGQQANSDLSAQLAGRGQNDAMFGQQTALGDSAYFSGQGVQQNGYNMGLQGVNASLGGQQTANSIRGQEMTGGIAGEDAKLRQWAAANGYTLTQQQMADQKEAAYIQAASTGLAAGATAMSDITAKKNIVPAEAAASGLGRVFGGGAYPQPQQPSGEQMAALDEANKNAVRNAPASFYDYKDPHAPGANSHKNFGPMAQDLAKTPAGATAVTKMPDGKLGVDTNRLSLVNTGALSAQQKQIDELEERIRQFAPRQPAAAAQGGFGAAQPVVQQPNYGAFDAYRNGQAYY